MQLKLTTLMNIMILFVMCFSFSVSAKTLENQEAIDGFYLARDGEALWLKGTKLNDAGKTLFETLQNSWVHGVNPKSYHSDQIELLIDNKLYGRKKGRDLALQLELLLTDGFVRYVRDLSGMRIDPVPLSLNRRDWLQRISAQDSLKLLSQKKYKADEIREILDRQEPQTETYQRLKSALVGLVQEDDHLDPIKVNIGRARVMRPGRGYDAIPQLRERLGLSLLEEEQNDRFKYDVALVDAVKLFQEKHGLKPDGLVGQQTIHALNHGKKEKINQLVVNMERLRWVADEKPDRFIVVNIPSARLWAIEHGSVAFTMPVIVGRKKRPTLSFVTKIHGVRFNPTWTVPPTIKKEDILPKLMENPAYLADKGMELFDGYGPQAPTLDPETVDWENISENDLHNLNMVQVPGAHNPLGRIRVLMPNKHNIYLHDTNNRSLFRRENRAKSSGCVRLQDPKKVALFALKNRKHWSPERMSEVLAAGSLKDVYTNDHTKVFLLYYTAWLGHEKQIVYGQDIYGYDTALLAQLQKFDKIPVFEDN